MSHAEHPCFNEAEALKPRILRGVILENRPAVDGFNEAEALKPRIHHRLWDDWRNDFIASMRPRH